MANTITTNDGTKIVKNAKLVVYKGGSHGICTTAKDRVSADLLAFIKE